MQSRVEGGVRREDEAERGRNSEEPPVSFDVDMHTDQFCNFFALTQRLFILFVQREARERAGWHIERRLQHVQDSAVHRWIATKAARDVWKREVD